MTVFDSSLQYIVSFAKSQQFLTVFQTLCYPQCVIEEQTYTIDEIEELTGFDRRTISYYVQQGLLPRVGRRGPRTRYSQLFCNRLRFIRMIRDLQDRGAIGTMTLSDFRDLFQSVPEEAIADVVGGRESPHMLARHASSDPPAMASPGDRRRAMVRRIEGLRRSVIDGASAPLPESRGVPMDPEPAQVTLQQFLS